MEREKEYIIPASRSCGCDHPCHSGAPMPSSIGCVSSAIRGLWTLWTPTTRISHPRSLDLWWGNWPSLEVATPWLGRCRAHGLVLLVASNYKAVDTRRACLTTSFITVRASLLKTMLAISSLTPFAKLKCSYVQKRIKITQQRKKQLKFENVAIRLTENIFITVS
jgi:hypothetical protein